MKRTTTTTTKQKRHPKGWYSAAKLRARLAAWCIAHGGVETTPETPEGHIYEDGSGPTTEVHAATYTLPSTIGPWDVHLPRDGEILLSINTRFRDAVRGQLPEDANQYSGKWNHDMSPPGDRAADDLFRDFTQRAERYVTKR